MWLTLPRGVAQVAMRSASHNRRHNAKLVTEEIHSHSAALVRQVRVVSDELIRIAILWHEQWHEALEEASRLYFGEGDVEGMLQARSLPRRSFPQPPPPPSQRLPSASPACIAG